MLIESFSGVRGIYGKDIIELTAHEYAKAYLAHKKPSKIVVARDTRPSAINIKEAMINAFSLNTDVIDLDVAPTPVAEFAVRHFKADGGVIITASHNEPEFIGWKFLRSDGAVLSPKDMEAVIHNYHNKNFPLDGTPKQITQTWVDKEYIDFILSLVGPINTNIKVLVDPNGGAACRIVKTLLEKLNIQATYLNNEEGIFNRLVEPKKESLAYLQPLLKEADFAVGFDCDADRAEFITKTGIISGQHLLALIVDDILSEKQSDYIVTNDCTSQMVAEIAKKYGTKTVEVEVGEIKVVEKMQELGAIVGGEGSSSGAIISPQTCRDGLLALAWMIKISSKQSIEQALQSLPKYYVSRVNVKTTMDYQQLKQKIKQKYENITETGDEKGSIKIHFDNAYLWFRPSRTEPNMLRIIADAKTQEEADKLLEEGKLF